MPSMKFHRDERGCHIWDAATNSRGYGVVWFQGKAHLAHRVAWFLEHGTWPTEGLVIDHICEVKRCVNVAHLRELTNSANLRRAYPRGDERTERKRAGWRRANARRRGTYRYTEGGESDSLVQD
ncbi:HNH endonuclease signature motif containing protein [Curtobacterium sp. MCBA15_004]|uniref:HNH endonuclease signature motif containing protein n=1 Tax=Curtobacterium sp. MCBA15_004 TaxID=1898733 RepID=UPI0008DCE9B8|nr:HNH endonuclease signature motif containing protein [Curtobacterium sp. MCBA15_004]WIA95824.1 HNH endonuclease signature motif containing protein [Curtobacterium sp. MCBA15_004]